MIKSNFLLIMWKLSIDAHNNKVSIIEEGKLLLIIKIEKETSIFPICRLPRSLSCFLEYLNISLHIAQ